jgi:hypothetical protein
MLGLGDFWVSSVFILLILSTLLCIVYGAINWNKGEKEEEAVVEDVKWKKEEKEIEDKL